MKVWPLNIHNKVITEASWHIQFMLLHKSFSGPQARYPLQSNGVLALLCLWPAFSSLPPLLVLLFLHHSVLSSVSSNFISIFSHMKRLEDNGLQRNWKSCWPVSSRHLKRIFSSFAVSLQLLLSASTSLPLFCPLFSLFMYKRKWTRTSLPLKELQLCADCTICQPAS